MENSCRKNLKQSSKKWVIASCYPKFRRNSALRSTNADLYHYAGNNPVRYIDPDGRLMRNADGSLKVENTDNIVKVDYTSNAGKGSVSYQQVYLFTDKGNAVMAFKNISFTPLYQDSTGDFVADGKYRFDLDLKKTEAVILHRKFGYDPTKAIETILNDEYEKCSKKEASIGVNKMKNGFLSIKKVSCSESFLWLKEYFVHLTPGDTPIPINKDIEKEFIFYKEK